MDHLWAPWRVKYVTKIIDKVKGCIFCSIFEQRSDAKNLIFVRGKYCYAVLNLYPYNNGHSLILPNRHINDISKMKKEERDEFFDLVLYVRDLLQEVMHPAGFNIGMNLGRIAGAGIPGHVHMHIVPRWKGDVNFMPAVGNTKVISQSLKELHKRLKAAHGKREKRKK